MKLGQSVYQEHRTLCRKRYQTDAKALFVEYVTPHFKEDGWSLDACAGRAVESGEFTRMQIVCAKSLHNYVDRGLLAIKNKDLPEKLRRTSAEARQREQKKILGRSIEERPHSVEAREGFAHLEADWAIGNKNKRTMVLLTLLERKTRNLMVLRVQNKTVLTVMAAFNRLYLDYGNYFENIFVQ